MCLGVPGRIVKIEDNETAVIELAHGVTVTADASTIESISEGDYVIIHAGIIISKLSMKDIDEWANTLENFLSDLEEGEERVLELLDDPR